MRLEDQVITLGQAQRLKELGVKQDSLFYHIMNKVIEIGYEGIKMREHLNQPKKTGIPVDGGVIQYYSAFTVAELGVMLPEWIYKGGEEYRRRQWRNTEDQYSEEEREIGLTKLGYCICYEVCMTHTKRISIGKDAEGVETRYAAEAAARASMLIHLLESKLITAEEVNSRL